MSHYEERLEHDLSEIRGQLADTGAKVLEAFKQSIHCVLIDDPELASEIVLGDLPINRQVRAIDALCHAFVARHLPSAGHLRFVSSALRLNVALERIGDYAVAIAREQIQLSHKPPKSFADDLELIAEQVTLMLAQALDAFNTGNADLARGTKPMGAQIEGTFEKVFNELVEEGERESASVRDLFALLTIINRIARVADQSKNICEETVFAATGETKEPKVYRILLLDKHNDSLSQLAAAHGRKAFPNSATFDSAGWSATRSVDPRAVAVGERYGLDLSNAEPTSLDSIYDQLDDTHVIVGLQGKLRKHLGKIPFRTTLLEWDVDYPDAQVDQQRMEATLEQSLQGVIAQIRELVETLRGEGAD
jgi:phosphate transport system protein